MSSADAQASPPRVHRCEDCGAPIPDLAIASRCEECGAPLEDDRFVTETVRTGLLTELRADEDGCLNCGGDAAKTFCSTACSEEWFATYTDAYLR